MLEYPEGGRNDFVHRLPSRTKQGNITLKRGVITKDKALIDWYTQTVAEVAAREPVIHLDDTDATSPSGPGASATPTRSSGPAADLNAGGTEFLTESLEIAHNGMTVRADDRLRLPPRASSRPSWSIDGGADARRATSTRPSTRSPRATSGSTRTSPARRSRSRSSRGGQPRQMELALLFDQTFPPYTMTVRAATAALLDAMEVPTGTSGGTPTAVPPFDHVPVGRADLQGRVHVAHLRVQAVPPGRRADPRRRQADAQAGGGDDQGPEPDDPRAGRLRHAHGQGRRHAAVDLLPRLRRRDALAPDRRGQRRRQPAAPAPRQLAGAAGAGELMPARPAEQHVAGIDVIVAGTASSIPSGATRRSRSRSSTRSRCPTWRSSGSSDPQGDNVDTPPAAARQGHRDQGRGDGRPRDDDDLQGPDRGRRAGVHGRRACIDLDPRLRQGAQAQPRAQDAHLPADVGLRHGQEGRQRGRADAEGDRRPASSTSSSSRATRPTGTSSGGSR